jgi:trehalose-phosphatase
MNRVKELLDHLPEVAARLDGGGPILLGLDFDGTLAPLCTHPDAVVLADAVRETVARLAAVDRVTVMIVSGRGLPDVAGKVALADLIYAGNHGMEIEGPGLSFVEPTAEALVPSLESVTVALRQRLAELPGTFVEPKRLTTCIHYRNVPAELWDDVARIMRETEAAHSDHFILTSGHQVWEIRPRVTWHKGEALRWAIEQLGGDVPPLVFFLGDDRTDEDAFASLPDAVTVKIGHPESPTHAHYRLDNPDAVHTFLQWLVERLGT